MVYHYGDSFDGIVVSWKDADGNPVSLAGYSAKLQARTATGNGTLVLELTSASAGLEINTSAGTVTINASPSKMTSSPSALVQGQGYFYDLQVTNGVETQTLLKGELWVDGEVTT